MATGDLITLAEYKLARRINDAKDDGEIARCITAASYWLAAESGRAFYRDGAASASARQFRPSRTGTLLVDDFSSTSGLVVVDSDGATLTLNTQFYVAPLNAIGPSGEAVAYYQLVKTDGYSWVDWGDGSRVSVTALWGWPSVPAAVKQAAVEVTGEFMSSRDATFGVVGFDSGLAVRLRSNPHVAAVMKTYDRGDRAPRFGFA